MNPSPTTDQQAHGPLVLVTNQWHEWPEETGTVTVIDTETNEEVKEIRVGAGPIGVEWHPDGRLAYVANSGIYGEGQQDHSAGHSVSVIDVKAGEEVATIDLGHNVGSGLTVHPSGDWVYAASRHGDTITIIDTDTNNIVKRVNPTGHGPAAALEVSPDGEDLYAPSSFDSSFGGFDDLIRELDPASGQTRDAFGQSGDGPSGMAFNSDGSRLYVATCGRGFDFGKNMCHGGGNVGISVIDTQQNQEIAFYTHPSFNALADLDVSPDDERLYIVGVGNDLIHVIDAQTGEHITNIELNSHPREISLSDLSDHGRQVAFVPDSEHDWVYVIDTNPDSETYHEIIDRVRTNSYPRGVSMQPSGVAAEGTAVTVENSGSSVQTPDPPGGLSGPSGPGTGVAVDQIKYGRAAVGPFTDHEQKQTLDVSLLDGQVEATLVESTADTTFASDTGQHAEGIAHLEHVQVADVLRVDAIRAVSTVNVDDGEASMSLEGSTVGKVVVGNQTHEITPGVEQTIPLPNERGSVTFFEQFNETDGANIAEQRVNAIHVRLNVTDGHKDILLGTAYAGAVNDGMFRIGPGTSSNVNANVGDAEISEKKIGRCLFSDDFESGENGWTHFGANDEWDHGVPATGPQEAASGENVWGTDLEQDYLNNANQTLESPTIDLTGVPSGTNLTLNFQLWFQTERGYDGGVVEVNTSDGVETIRPTGGPDYEDADDVNEPEGPAYNGDLGGWHDARFNLNDYAGEKINLRFRLASDAAGTADGFYADDVEVCTIVAETPSIGIAACEDAVPESVPDAACALVPSTNDSFEENCERYLADDICAVGVAGVQTATQRVASTVNTTRNQLCERYQHDLEGGCQQWVHQLEDENREQHVETQLGPDEATQYTLAREQDRWGNMEGMRVLATNATNGTTDWTTVVDPGSNARPMALDVSEDLVAIASWNFDNGRDWQTIVLDADTGEEVWRATFDGPASNTDLAQDVEIGPDGEQVFVIGETRNQDVEEFTVRRCGFFSCFTDTRHRTHTWTNMRTVAYNATSGAQQWTHVFNSGDDATCETCNDHNHRSDRGRRVAVADNGTVVVSGEDASNDVRTFALDATNGAERWGAQFEGRNNANDRVRHLDVSPDGELNVGIRSHDAVNWDTRWDYTLVSYDLETGYERFSTHEDRAKSHDFVRDVASTEDRILVTGQSRGQDGYDWWTIAYHDDGSKNWTRTLDGNRSHNDEAQSLAFGPDAETTYVVGTTLNHHTGRDLTTVAYNTTKGNVSWGEVYDNNITHERGYSASVVDTLLGHSVLASGETRNDTTNRRDLTTVRFGAGLENSDRTTDDVVQFAKEEVPERTLDETDGALATAEQVVDFLESQIPACSEIVDQEAVCEAVPGVTTDPNAACKEVASELLCANVPTIDEVNDRVLDEIAAVDQDVCESTGSTLMGGCQQWENRSEGDARDSAVDLTVGLGGNVSFVTGMTETGGELALRTTAYNVSDGSELWSTTIDAGSQTVPAAIETAGELVYVIGTVQNSNEDFLTVAFNATTGEEVWTRVFDGPDNGPDRGNDLAVGPDGDTVYVTGSSRDTTRVRVCGSFNCFFDTRRKMEFRVNAYDAKTGQTAWSADFDDGSRRNNLAKEIAVSADGDTIVATGQRQGGNEDVLTAGFDASTGENLWNDRFNGGNADMPVDVVADDEKAYVAISAGFRVAADMVTRAFDLSSGSVDWTNTFDANESEDRPESLALADDTLFLAGTSLVQDHRTDGAVVALDPANGGQVWSTLIEGMEGTTDRVKDLAVGPNARNVYVAGMTVTESGGSDYLTAGLNATTGRIDWQATYDAAVNTDRAAAIGVGSASVGHTIVTTGSSERPATETDWATLAYDSGVLDALQGDELAPEAAIENLADNVDAPETGDICVPATPVRPVPFCPLRGVPLPELPGEEALPETPGEEALPATPGEDDVPQAPGEEDVPETPIDDAAPEQPNPDDVSAPAPVSSAVADASQTAEGLAGPWVTFVEDGVEPWIAFVEQKSGVDAPDR